MIGITPAEGGLASLAHEWRDVWGLGLGVGPMGCILSLVCSRRVQFYVGVGR